MDTEEMRKKALELQSQGYPKAEIARMLNISRPTLYKLLEEGEQKTEEGTKHDVDAFVSEQEKLASDIVERMQNPYYGKIINEVFARHGIVVRNGPYDKVFNAIDEYGLDTLIQAIPLAKKLTDADINPKAFDPENLNLLPEMATVMKRVNPENFKYFGSFLQFLKTPGINKSIDEIIKMGATRKDAIHQVLYSMSLQLENAEYYETLISKVSDAVTEKAVQNFREAVRSTVNHIEAQAIDGLLDTLARAGEDMIRRAMEAFQEAVERKAEELKELTNTIEEKIDLILKLEEADIKGLERGVGRHLIGGVYKALNAK